MVAARVLSLETHVSLFQRVRDVRLMCSYIHCGCVCAVFMSNVRCCRGIALI